MRRGKRAVRNPITHVTRIQRGLRFCPRCGLVTFGEGLPKCDGRVMWGRTNVERKVPPMALIRPESSLRGIDGHDPVETEWVRL